jgi:5-formyltetrahydrofolate cyclo-ligase
VNSTELKRAKRAVRARVLGRRDEIDPEERSRRGERIVRRFLSLPETEAAGTVMAFWAFGSEVPTDALISRLVERGVTVALPRIVGDHLEPRTWRPGEPVTQTHFGAREPQGGRVVQPREIDVVAVPGVAFDRAGGRVGYGGGFYDRFLPSTRALRAAIAFDAQLEEEPLPGAGFDLPVDVIVTESGTIRCARD